MRWWLVLTLLPVGACTMAQDAFRNHGLPAPVAELRGAAALHDGNGHNLVVIVPLDLSKRGYLLAVDVDSGETFQYFYPQPVPLAGAFASLLSQNGKFYTGEAGYLLEFDPTSRQFTFAGKPHEESGHFVGQSIIDGPDGLLYIGTYPTSHLVSFDPKTKAFHDFGQVDPEEKYFNYLAYDDSGWMYCGIGTARMSLVACNLKSGEKRQLLPDAQRVVGSATVFTGADGKAYGSAGSNWYRLYQGQAQPITRADVAPKAPSGQIGYGGRLETLPDGRQIRVDLESNRLTVVDPKSNESRVIVLKYQSGGAGVSSLVAGPDGRLYTSTNHPMHFSSYEPATDKLRDMGPVANVGGGNFCAMAVQGKYIAAASYSLGIFHVFDTTRPFNGGYGEDPNPREVARWPEDICRPRTVLAHSDGRHVFMAGYAGYGRVGGGLGRFDLQTEEAVLVRHEQLIPGQSTICLKELPDGNLIGGTSTEAPGGGHPTAKEALLYGYDWKAGKVLYQTSPVLGAGDIVGLEIGADGLVYGVASGSKLFVFDPAKREVVHTADLSEFGGAPRNSLQRQPDGNIYAVLSQALVKIEPKTFKLTKLADLPVAATAGMAILEGRLYYVCGAELWSYKLP